jgi:hypothetical protein
MIRNSTIKQKVGICDVCVAKGDNSQKPLIKGKCPSHYQQERNRICADRKEQRKQSGRTKQVNSPDPLQGLIDDADAIFSKWVRLNGADELGYNKCFTSGEIAHWSELQNGHYISRGCMYLRYDPRNCRPQHGKDNVGKHGNLSVFAAKLEEEKPGITSILEEESNIAYSHSREDLRAIISEYTEKVNNLLKNIR